MNTSEKSLPIINDLTLDEKIGQMFIIDFPGYSLDEKTRKHFDSFPWGGVILFAKNVQSYQQVVDLNRSIIGLNEKIPVLISVDQEGGIVNRADFDSMNLSPGNMALGAAGDPEAVKTLARISGLELRGLGFHMDCAPAADVNSNPDNPIIGVRSYGEDPKMVAEMTAAAVQGFQEAGLAACAKHFPGHGDTYLDSHLKLPVIKTPLEQLEKVELPPFQAAIDAGTEFMMTAHIVFPAVDGDTPPPATMSRRILTEILRDKMGFKKIITTDSMGMKAIADNFPAGEAAVMSVEAGADMVMALGTFETQAESFMALHSAVESGRISIERIDQSVERILDFKRRYILNPPPPLDIPPEKRREITRNITGRTIKVLYGDRDVLKKVPTGARILVLSPDRVFRTALDESDTRASVYHFLKEKMPGLERIVYNPENPEEKINPILEGEAYDIYLPEICSRGKMPESLKNSWEGIIKGMKSQGGKTVIISLLGPYGLPSNGDLMITGFNYSPLSLEMVAEALC